MANSIENTILKIKLAKMDRILPKSMMKRPPDTIKEAWLNYLETSAVVFLEIIRVLSIFKTNHVQI